MNDIRQVTDERLFQHVERLERDIEDFDARARRQKTALERENRFSWSEPLYQRFASIGNHLRTDLQRAQEELDRRQRTQPARRGWFFFGGTQK